MGDLLLSAHNVGCIRGGRLLFSGLSFSLTKGESLLLRGPNGIGKSSLLRIAAGLLPCSQGEMRSEGRIALADERVGLDHNNRLSDALGLWSRIDAASTGAVYRATDHFGLSALMDVPVRMLSTGQRKRAALVRTIASGAAIWLLDEPGNGLDRNSLALLGSEMDAHLRNGGAIVAASHFDLPHGFSQMIDLTELVS